MTITPDNLRANFKEFTSVTVYPDTTIQFWLDTAYQLLRPQVWGKSLDMGIQLFTAHNLVLEAEAVKQAATGGLPGTTVGPANSKSVDKVSVGYDTGAGTVPGWGNWNRTTYGTRFKYFVNIFGAGGIQVNTCGPIAPFPLVIY